MSMAEEELAKLQRHHADLLANRDGYKKECERYRRKWEDAENESSRLAGVVSALHLELKNMRQMFDSMRKVNWQLWTITLIVLLANIYELWKR